MSIKIAVIFTGGTIGSVYRSGVIDTDLSASETLLDGFAKNRSDVSFVPFRPADTLSENMTAEIAKDVENCVRERLSEDFDGIVITHGTDTLTFTANLFSQLFADTPIPVVFVSADMPLNEGGNGADNFAAAVDFVSAKIRGVFVAYKNRGEQAKIHLASRIVDSAQLTGYVLSLANVEFGSVVNGSFVWNDDPLNPSPAELNSNPFEVPPGERLSTEVVSLIGRSMTDFRYLNFETQPPKALVYKLYHSGTACTAAGKYDVSAFLKRLAEAGIETVVSPVKGSKRTYCGADKIYAAATYVAKDISFEMSLIKTMLAVGSGKDAGELLSENRAFEKLIEYR